MALNGRSKRANALPSESQERNGPAIGSRWPLLTASRGYFPFLTTLSGTATKQSSKFCRQSVVLSVTSYCQRKVMSDDQRKNQRERLFTSKFLTTFKQESSLGSWNVATSSKISLSSWTTFSSRVSWQNKVT